MATAWAVTSSGARSVIGRWPPNSPPWSKPRGVEVLTDSTVTGRYEDNWTAIVQRNHPIAVERLIKARAKVLVAAPGLIERPYVFDGNDKPGVMLSGAVRRFVNMYAVKPGSTAVVFTANPDGDAAAADLERAGADVTVVDARRGEDIVRARGGAKAVNGVELADGRRLDCDLLVTAAGWTAPTSLLNMSGDRPVYDDAAARFFPSVPIGNVLATGGLAGDGSMDELIGHARATPAGWPLPGRGWWAIGYRRRPLGRGPWTVRNPSGLWTSGPALPRGSPSGPLPIDHARGGRLLRGRQLQGHGGVRRPRDTTP